MVQQPSDQFAFRPTASIGLTAALVLSSSRQLLTLQSSLMSLSSRWISLRHSTPFGIPRSHSLIYSIYNIQFHHLLPQGSFPRNALCRADVRYCLGYIDSSVVLGSGFGPSSFDVVASYLHHLPQSNSIIKYVNDTYLIVPAFARSRVRAK